MPGCVVLAVPLLLALLSQPQAARSDGEKDSDKPLRCSIVRLLANPDQYDGRKVRTFGYLVLESENKALYLSEADAAAGIHANAVWLEGALPEALGSKYVMIEGYFDSKSVQSDLYAGSIRGVSRYAIMTAHTDYDIE